MVVEAGSAMPTKPSKKLLNPNRNTEQEGLIFIQKMALALKAIWRPTPNDDYGLDGELELTRDREPTGFLVKAQVKSGASYIRNPSTSGFDYHAKPADAEYWLKVNVPVILVVHDPRSGHGYWIDIKKYAAQHPDFPATPVIRFSKRGNLLSAESLLDFSETAIPDEVERTEFLVDQIREQLHSNMLPVTAVPPSVYEAEFSLRRLAEADEAGYKIAKTQSGKYVGFIDPRGPTSRVKNLIETDSVTEWRYPDYLRRSTTRNHAIACWNDALCSRLFTLGLLQKDKGLFYFPPCSDGTARKLIWESARGRTPERQVAYPYIGKKSQATMFWVHHACRMAFCEVGGQFFLRIMPAYVFSHDGSKLIAGKEAGSLTTSRVSKDRNYQVFNHLMFWRWFLADGHDSLSLAVEHSEVHVAIQFLSAEATFGIPADKKSLIEIIAAEHEVDWAELEAAASNDIEESE